MAQFELTSGYVPGFIGRVTELHAAYYNKHWGFGAYFEIKMAEELADFVQRYDLEKDLIQTVVLEGQIEGAITIDGSQAHGKGAHLRWFIVSEALQGKGGGARLINSAVAFCRKKNYRKVYLWTFKGLDAARHLYEKAGFSLVEQQIGKQWGQPVNEQRMEIALP